MSEGKLNEDEIRRAKMCVANIKDKLQAIESELERSYSYKYYIAEKIDSVCFDSNCIKRMCEVEEDVQ